MTLRLLARRGPIASAFAEAGGVITEVGSTIQHGPAAGGTATRSITKPGTLANGDVAYWWVFNRFDDAVPTNTVTGETLLGDIVSGTSARLLLYRKVITNAAGEPATWDWTFPGEVTGNGVRARVFRGVDNTTPEDVASISAHFIASSGSATHAAPDITTVTNGAVVMIAQASRSLVTLSFDNSFTEPAAEVTGTSSMLGHAERTMATAGAVGVTTLTNNASSSTVLGIVALRPA